MRFRQIGLGGRVVMAVIVALASAHSARAAGWDTHNAGQVSASSLGTAMMQPIGQLTLPVEVAALESHVGLQFNYTNMGILNTDISVIGLALDAQIALWDRLELGLNVPFLLHGWVGGGLGQLSGADTQFGNMQVNLKGKLAGDSRGSYAVSVFANTTLPTTSGDIKDRSWAVLHTGLAATGQAGGIGTFGGAVGMWAFLNGNNVVLYTMDFFGGVKLHPMFGLQVAAQVGVPIEPDGAEVAFAITPALQFFPIEDLHVDVGSRIGVTDAGRAYSGGGRASLVVAAGYTF